MYTCVPNSPYSDLDAGPSDPHPEPEPYDYHMLDTPILFMFRGALSTCIENMCPSFFVFFFYRRLRHEASRLFTISSLCFPANISGLFWSLWTGFCTYIVNNELFKRPVDGMKEGCCVWNTELFIFIVSHAEQLHRNILFSAIRAKKLNIFCL